MSGLNRSVSPIIAISVCILLVVLLFVLTSFTNTSPGTAKRAATLSNLKQIGIATIDYSIDFDDKFPPDMSSSSSCQIFIRPYSKDYQSALKSYNPSKNEFLGNGSLASRLVREVGSPARTLMFFDAAPWSGQFRCVVFVDTHASTRKEAAFQVAIANHLVEKE